MSHLNKLDKNVKNKKKNQKQFPHNITNAIPIIIANLADLNQEQHQIIQDQVISLDLFPNLEINHLKQRIHKRPNYLTCRIRQELHFKQVKTLNH